MSRWRRRSLVVVLMLSFALAAPAVATAGNCPPDYSPVRVQFPPSGPAAPAVVTQNWTCSAAAAIYAPGSCSSPPAPWLSASPFIVPGSSLPVPVTLTFDANQTECGYYPQTLQFGPAVGDAVTLHLTGAFRDVASTHILDRFIHGLAGAVGDLADCGDREFCPSAPLMRAQAAAWLLHGKFGRCYSPPPTDCSNCGCFTDIAGLPEEGYITELCRLKITSGCMPTQFCPAVPVTRAQIAVLLLTTLLGSCYVPPPATGFLFSDVPASDVYAPWIEDLVNRGIAAGCSPSQYCPTGPVTREAAAVLMVRTFNLPMAPP